MKRTFTTFLAVLALCAVFIGCKTPTLEPGGAYAPVDTNGVPTLLPDVGFYTTDAAYRVVHSAGMMIFDYEKENRATLWKLSPNIKKELDKIRPEFWQWNGFYLRARNGYMLHPTPAGLDAMNTALAKLRQVSDASQAVIPQLVK